MSARPYQLTPMEVALGWVFGELDPVPRQPGPARPPRAVLEEVILESLQRPPCGVAFSGGRDSSLVLAVAVQVARREGLPLPVPLTYVFEGADRADESEWQELVVQHLGLTEWERITLTDELDLLGPYATDVLRRHGLVWPTLSHSQVPLYERLGGGSLLDGEGGDEVLGDESHRIAPVKYLIDHPRSASRWAVRRAIGAVAPAPVRRAWVRRREAAEVDPWLRAPARAELLRRVAQDEAAGESLSFDRSVRRIARERSGTIMRETEVILAADHDVVPASPLLDDRVVDALARDGGFLGPGTRTEVIRSLAADCLPTALIERESKAEFGQAYLGEPSRAFARRWTGEGIDATLVDPDRLRAEWLSDEPSALTAALLQTAWLATECHSA